MEDKHLKLLEDIKKLLVLQLIKNDVQSRDIATVLKVDPATITRMVPRSGGKGSKKG